MFKLYRYNTYIIYILIYTDIYLCVHVYIYTYVYNIHIHTCNAYKDLIADCLELFHSGLIN